MDANFPRYAALVMLAMASVPGFAQSATVADLDKIQSGTLMLRAQAAQAQASAELAALRNDGANAGTNLTAEGGGLPVARGVFGANGKRYVSFLYSTGGTADAGEGQQIPGGYIVRSFDSNGVVLAKSGKTHRIPFSLQAPTVAESAPVMPTSARTFAPATGPVSPVPPMR